MVKCTLALVFALVFTLSGVHAMAESTATFRVQPRSSSLTFTARSMVGRISASMGFQSGTIVTGPSGQILSAEIIVNARSLSGSGIVRSQLAGRSGFDIEEHPQIVFRATQVTQRGSEIDMGGDLTMRGITHPARFSGTIEGPNAGLLTLTLSAELDRTKWRINAGRPLYSRRGTVAVSIRAARRKG